MFCKVVSCCISIHALLAESDRIVLRRRYINGIFLSTLSLRRATRKLITRRAYHEHFYPRSPCGERHAARLLSFLGIEISIHALLAESDGARRLAIGQARNFYPRSPCGERHGRKLRITVTGKFLSTLSLRRATLYRRRAAYPTEFLSTLSLRRATAIDVFLAVWAVISIHALLAESDKADSATKWTAS